MDRIRVQICMGSSCHSRGNYEIAQLLSEYQKEEPRVEVVGSLCEEMCSEGPIVRVGDQVLPRADAATLRAAIEETFSVLVADEE
jgi:NADH:ubiquinone oxidoreductase subunit E